MSVLQYPELKKKFNEFLNKYIVFGNVIKLLHKYNRWGYIFGDLVHLRQFCVFCVCFCHYWWVNGLLKDCRKFSIKSMEYHRKYEYYEKTFFTTK